MAWAAGRRARTHIAICDESGNRGHGREEDAPVHILQYVTRVGIVDMDERETRLYTYCNMCTGVGRRIGCMGARALQFNLFRAECYFFVQNAISLCRTLFLADQRHSENGCAARLLFL